MCSGMAGYKRKEKRIMVYKWEGRKFGVSADIVGKEVEKIEKKYGEVTSRNFVEAARSESSPLHKLLEWDDTVAAEKFRIHQAGVIICHLHIEREDTLEPKTVRAYMNVADNVDNPTRRTGSFINTQDVFSDKEKRALILRVAIRELKELREKYIALSELADIFERIEKLS